MLLSTFASSAYLPPVRLKGRARTVTALRDLKTVSAMAIKGSEFHVVLGNMKLSRESEQRISSAIQKAVLSELAAYKPNPEDPGNPFGPRLPGGGGPHPHIVLKPEWLGLIMHRLEGIRELEGVAKELEKVGQQHFLG